MTETQPPPAPPGQTALAGMPVWVKVFGIVAVPVAVLFVVSHLAGGGFRHHGGSNAAVSKSDGGP